MTYTPNSKGQATNRQKHGARTAATSSLPRVRDFVFGVRKQLKEFEAEGDKDQLLRRYAFGLVELQPRTFFREIDGLGRLHLCGELAHGVVHNVIEWRVNDVIVHPGSQIDQNGNVFGGGSVFTGLARLRLRRGLDGQAADPQLVAETSAETSFRATGVAHTYTRFVKNETVFGTEDPEVFVVCRAGNPRDPRTGTKRFTMNPAVLAYDLLTRSKLENGAGIDPRYIDLPSWQAGANLCETFRTVKPQTFTSIASISSINVFQFATQLCPFQQHDVVTVKLKAGGSLPAGISPGVEYHVIVFKMTVGDAFPEIKLATSYANCRDNIAILHGQVTHDLLITKVKEPFGLAAGEYLSNQRGEILEQMLAAFGGRVARIGGKITLLLPEFPVSTVPVGEDDMIGTVVLNTRQKGGDRANTIIGEYNTPLARFVGRDYPAVSAAEFVAADQGEELVQRLDLDFVPNAAQAQALARIELFGGRLEEDLSFPAKLALWRLKPGDVAEMTIDRLGMVGEFFECQSRQLVLETQGDTANLKLDFQLRETAPEVFDPDTDAEQIVSISKQAQLRDPREVDPPGQPAITEQQFQTTVGGGLRIKVIVHWEPSADPFLASYTVRHRPAGSTVPTTIRNLVENTIEIVDIGPGDWFFSVQAVNTLGFPSGEVSRIVRLEGFTAPPAQPSGFNVQLVGTKALATWNGAQELDVRVGGTIQIRHHTDENGGRSIDSLLLTTVQGDLATATVSFKRGTYYIRFIDQGGRPGPFAEFSTAGVHPVQFAQIVLASGAFDPTDLAIDEATFQEDSEFPGISHPDNLNVEIVAIEGIRRLRLTETNVGGVITVASSGVYHFSSGLEFSDILRFRVETLIESILLDTSDLLDSRPGNVDDYPSWDGEVDPDQADAWIEIRTTRADPAANLWSDWRRVETVDLRERGVQYRLQLRSFADPINIHITKLRGFARELFDPGQVRPGTSIPPAPPTLDIPVPRVGATSLKEAAYSPRVVRVGFAAPDERGPGMIARFFTDFTQMTASNHNKIVRWQADALPWDGSNNFEPDFEEPDKYYDDIKGLPSMYHTFFWPSEEGGFAGATPATDASNIEARARSYMRTAYQAYGPAALQGKGDQLTGRRADLFNEIVNETDIANAFIRAGTFRSVLGTQWFVSVMQWAREELPGVRLGFNDFGIIQGFQYAAESNAAPGVTLDNRGARYFGNRNSRLEIIRRHKYLEILYILKDNGLTADVIGLQSNITTATVAPPPAVGTSGSARTFIDLAAIADFCAECHAMGCAVVMTETRIVHGGSSPEDPTTIGRVEEANGEDMAELIKTVYAHSRGDELHFWNSFAIGNYIAIIADNVTGARRTTPIDMYQYAIDGVSQLTEFATREIEPVHARRLLLDPAELDIRPVTVTGSIGFPDRRAGIFLHAQTGTVEIDLADIEANVGISIDECILLFDVFIMSEPCEAAGEYFVELSDDGAGVTPSVYGGNLQFYFDTRLGAAGDPVTSWTEQVEGNAFVPDTGGTSPDFVPSDFNGQPGIDFSGDVNNRLYFDDVAYGGLWAGAGIKRLHVLARIDTVGGNPGGWNVIAYKSFLGSGAGNQGWRCAINTSTGALTFQHKDSSSAIFAITVTAFSYSDGDIVAFSLAWDGDPTSSANVSARVYNNSTGQFDDLTPGSGLSVTTQAGTIGTDGNFGLVIGNHTDPTLDGGIGFDSVFQGSIGLVYFTNPGINNLDGAIFAPFGIGIGVGGITLFCTNDQGQIAIQPRSPVGTDLLTPSDSSPTGQDTGFLMDTGETPYSGAGFSFGNTITNPDAAEANQRSTRFLMQISRARNEIKASFAGSPVVTKAPSAATWAKPTTAVLLTRRDGAPDGTASRSSKAIARYKLYQNNNRTDAQLTALSGAPWGTVD